MKTVHTLASPIGTLWLAEAHGALTDVSFRAVDGRDGTSPVLEQAAAQLREYFAGTRQVFDLPLTPSGTPFRLAVWQALSDIPYGQTRSYKDIAISVDCPKGFRAVGQANHHNPIAIIVPCHRVISADGTLGGYGGGLDIKSALLALEQDNLEKAQP